MLREDESPESGNDRFNSLSPISYALKKADDENLHWVILSQGGGIRLYASSTKVGVGRRGRTETYIECQPSLLADDKIAYLWLLFSAQALASNGSLSEILNESQRFAGDLAVRLRERIYDDVIPNLAKGIANEVKEHLSKQKLSDIYEMAITILFRLLFIAYAEDRDLLPYRSNDAYRQRSLKQKAQELTEYIIKDTPIAQGDSHWKEIELLWRAISEGNSEWGIPAYDGGLFADDPEVSKAGAELATITLSNEIFENTLRQLLVIKTPDGVTGPVDFRSLSVREFGTIYEGLLESELALADRDLVIDGSQKTYAPAKEGQECDIVCGEVYIHNRSGARKSSGSYYTKSFAVEHLLDGALEPALDDHFSWLDQKDDTGVAESFFQFRVADIAMGSGHFLIAAIDRIERRMADWLAGRSIPGVRRELAQLRESASKQLCDIAEGFEIDDSQLLRRLIARRCIYGVDLNALSVQLARLAVWIHTFVPGLPLSFLDHNLIHGNSLIGVGDVEEIKENFEKERKIRRDLFWPKLNSDTLLGAAKRPLLRLANIRDETLADIDIARLSAQEVRDAIVDREQLCDVITAQSIDPSIVSQEDPFTFKEAENQIDILVNEDVVKDAKETLKDLHVIHFPICFPEVFLDDHPGFHVLLGNPPWEEVTVEEDAFWARHFPGLRGFPQREQEAEKVRLRTERRDLVEIYESELNSKEQMRKALASGAYPGMGTGDPDLYKAFCWRFWQLTHNQRGRIGVVLPRSALSAKGTAEFRKLIFERSSGFDVTVLENKGEWIFSDVHPQYTIGLVCITHQHLACPEGEGIRIRGPYTSEIDFRNGVEQPVTTFDRKEVLTWTDTASLPLLPDASSIDIFAQIRKSPRLDLKDTEVSRGGGARVGAHVPTEKWMLLSRNHSWYSTGQTEVVGAPRQRTSRHCTKASNDFRNSIHSRWLLASIQGSILQYLESRY